MTWGPEHASPDRTDEPPSQGSERRRAIIAIVVVLTTVTVAAWVAARSVAMPADRLPGMAALIPSDGDVSVFRLSNAAGDSVMFQEHQRVSGFKAITALPELVAGQVLLALPDDDLDERLFWRIASRQMRDDQVGPQTIDLLTVDDMGISRLASFGGNVPTIYQPPLLVVPAAPTQGQAWSATGSALFDGALAYTHRASVERLDADGCVVIASQLDLTFGDAPFTSQTTNDRWCPGRGTVEGEGSIDQGVGPETIQYVAVDQFEPLVQAEQRPAAPEIADRSEPSTWTRTLVTPAKRDVFLGDMAVDGISGLAPVAGADGLLLTVLGNGSDVLGFRLGEPLEGADAGSLPLLEQWRVHPGGDPLAMALVDDLVLVTTSTRRLVAYDLNGVRRWMFETDDLVLRPPVRLGVEPGDDIVVVQDLNGRVTALDADTGAVRWSERTRTESDLGPVALDGAVVVADRSGDLMALDAASGERLWVNRQPDIAAVGSVGSQLYVALTDGSVTAIDPRGAQRWQARLDTAPERIDDVGGQPAFVGGGAVTVLDPTSGVTAWTRSVSRWADGWVGGLAIHQGDQVCAIDVDGNDISCWPHDDEGSVIAVYVVADDDGLWVFDSGFGVARIASASGGLGS